MEDLELEDALEFAAAYAVPEVIIPIEVAQESRRKVRDAARGFFHWFVHEAALTEEEGYEGLGPALGLAYYYLWPPIQTAWHIEQQVVGVLEQVFKFLGGVGSAVNAGASALGTLGKDLGAGLKWISGGWL